MTETYIRWKNHNRCVIHHVSGGTGYWLLQLLDKVSPSQWVAIGVLGSLLFGLLTYLTNLYFKIKEDKRKAARGE
ncbi:lysis S family protein [Escherichia coli DEC8D]|nr:lysis S family protein [Escherichia coli DEC8D]